MKQAARRIERQAIEAGPAFRLRTVIMAVVLSFGVMGVQAGGPHSGHYSGSGHHWGGYGHHYRGWGGGYYRPYHGYWGHYPSFSFYVAPPPVYSPVYYPAYAAYPAYPAEYVQSRPNYAVGGALLGALAGGLIGDSIHHQGWEGAGIGAAAGLLFGGLAEHQARKTAPAVVPPTVSYAAPTGPVQTSGIADAPSVANAPTAPAAPTVASPPPNGSAVMSRANNLFGR